MTSKISPRSLLLAGTLAFAAPVAAHAAPVNFAPTAWTAADRAAAEATEAANMHATRSQDYSGTRGIVSAIASPIAVQAGLEVLKRGGTAADAATAIAMTQVTTQFGSVVSFAGIMAGLYYDKASDKVYSLDAGFNSFRGETDPETIPGADLGALDASKRTGTAGGGNLPGLPSAAGRHDLGREVLVPGFMAGFEALHKRFGKLPWASMFDAAIYYAEHGVTLSPSTAGFFAWRADILRRTPEGTAFLKQGGDAALPKAGERFLQPALARTLRAVAAHGAAYMYTGDWAKHFVTIVQREGGKVVADDLASYKVIWTEPLTTSFGGATIYAPGKVSYAGYNILPALNLVEALGLETKPPYYKDPASFVTLTGASQFLDGAPNLNPATAKLLADHGIDASPEAQLTKAFAQKAAPLVSNIYVVPNGDDHHSNSIVVVDAQGNVAAFTHTINSVVWGSTGIVIDGIPLPDSAGFQQARLKTLKPGDRLPHEMIQTIAMRGGKPVFATSSIGASLIPESLRLILGVVGQGRPLAEVQAAPPLLANFAIGVKEPGASAGKTPVPHTGYSADFLAAVKKLGLSTVEMTDQMAGAMRGTITAVSIDPASGVRSTSDVDGMLVFGGAEK